LHTSVDQQQTHLINARMLNHIQAAKSIDETMEAPPVLELHYPTQEAKLAQEPDGLSCKTCRPNVADASAKVPGVLRYDWEKGDRFKYEISLQSFQIKKQICGTLIYTKVAKCLPALPCKSGEDTWLECLQGDNREQKPNIIRKRGTTSILIIKTASKQAQKHICIYSVVLNQDFVTQYF
jgi:hypothetical protein